MWSRFKNWLDVNSATRHLQRLDDRLLADMGVERGEIRDRIAGRTSSAEEPLACCQKSREDRSVEMILNLSRISSVP
jgi:uncharacterized protein YjiS (DUF1127 family)